METDTGVSMSLGLEAYTEEVLLWRQGGEMGRDTKTGGGRMMSGWGGGGG